ncbi:uncharacterized protein [Chaetodon trifascialis]|uniref:uncharacterized protein n=1 Tax=Chaetodon trifascialis TaxID=109706 RepID=UPI00399363BD
MLGFQPIRDSQKADFVLGLLEGEAKREILTLERTDRNTPKKLFDIMSELYGDKTHACTVTLMLLQVPTEPIDPEPSPTMLNTNGILKADQSVMHVMKRDTLAVTALPRHPTRIFEFSGHCGDCWEELFNRRKSGLNCSNSPLFSKEWNGIFVDCQRIHAASISHKWQATARLASRSTVTIPAQSEALVWAKIPSEPLRQQCYGLVEPLGENRGVEVARALVTVGSGRVPLRVRNIHPYAIDLSRFQRLATVSAIDPGNVREGKKLSLIEVSPGVVEVDLVNTDQELLRAAGDAEFSLKGDGLTEGEQQQLDQLLLKWQHVFSTHEEDYGCTDVMKHRIPTGNTEPIRERFRPVPPTLYKEIHSLLKGMLVGGVIKESCSPWAAPIVLVQKKCGAWRFCVDYRKLNNVTHKDAFPLPRIEDSLTSLNQAEWYSTLDLASGYWQVEVEESDKEKTAFTTPFGLFEFERMPFGLCNAPATFQRLMQRCLGEQLTESALVYLDDVIVFSRNFSDHLDHLESVFQALEHYGLKLRPEKCQLFQKQVKFFGHVVSSQVVSPDSDKVAAVAGWQPPGTVRQVRAFLGFVGYYRRFIRGFSKIAKPLNELLAGTGCSRGRRSPSVQWTDQCEAAFQQLKRELLQAPILAYADYTLPFIIYTDASNCGLGAVLAQEQDGLERVIAYASRSLHPPERNDSNYSSFKLELLAMKLAVVEKFKDYLWGAKVTVATDNNPLVHLQTAKLGAVEQRWVAQLANFDYAIKYRPGKDNTNADVLSRFPAAPMGSGQAGERPEEERRVRAVEAPPSPEALPDSWGWDPELWKNIQTEDLSPTVMGSVPSTGGAPWVGEVAVPFEKELLLAPNGGDCEDLDSSLLTLHSAQGQTTGQVSEYTGYDRSVLKVCMGSPHLRPNGFDNSPCSMDTWYAPAFLMFGRHLRIPVDMLTGATRPATPDNTMDWVDRHQEQLHYAYRKASNSLEKAAEKNKKLYDRTARGVALLPGERVLVLDQRRQQKGKLGDRWEKQPYVVVSWPRPEHPVYQIRPEGKEGPIRSLHRNLLRPCLHYAPQGTTAAEGGEFQRTALQWNYKETAWGPNPCYTENLPLAAAGTVVNPFDQFPCSATELYPPNKVHNMVTHGLPTA